MTPSWPAGRLRSADPRPFAAVAARDREAAWVAWRGNLAAFLSLLGALVHRKMVGPVDGALEHVRRATWIGASARDGVTPRDSHALLGPKFASSFAEQSS